jgi:hypothetical protein
MNLLLPSSGYREVEAAVPPKHYQLSKKVQQTFANPVAVNPDVG